MKDEFGSPYSEDERQLIRDAKDKYYNVVDNSGLIELRRSNGNGEDGNNGSRNGKFNVKPKWEYVRFDQDNTWQVADVLFEIQYNIHSTLAPTLILDAIHYSGCFD